MEISIIVWTIACLLITVFFWLLWGHREHILSILHDFLRLPSPIKLGKPCLTSPATHSSLSLAWSVSGYTSRIAKYKLSYRSISHERANINQEQWTTIELPNLEAKYSMKNLEPETSYQIQVTAVADDEQEYPGEISDVLSTSQLPIPPSPKGIRLVGQPTLNSMTITWDMTDYSDLISAYTVFYTNLNNEQEARQWTIFECKDNPVSITELIPNTKYIIKVAASSVYCTSLPSQTSEPIATLMPPPKNLELKYTPDQAYSRLVWEMEDIGPMQVTSFTVHHKKQDDKTWKTLSTDGPQTSLDLPELVPGTKIYVKLVANTANGESPYSEMFPFDTPLPCPGTPRLASNSKPTHDTISLVWDVNMKNEIPPNVISYIVQYKDTKKEEWEEQDTASGETVYDLYNLSPETTYAVRVISQSASVSSPPSEVGGPFTTTVYRTKDEIFKENIKRNSRPVNRDGMGKGMTLHQVRLSVQKENSRIKIVEFVSKEKKAAEEKVIMVVGATGAGKSTLINGMINYVLGTSWSDKFRFRLVEENASAETRHKSQTKLVTIYRLHHREEMKIPYNLTIIDTPGFGDSEGVEQDKQTIQSIGELFRTPEYGVHHIDVIGFVAQSSLAVLTPTQKYIFQSILSLFGKDIANNIYLLITFCDPQEPPVLASIKAANVPYQAHYKFNNSALFASNSSETQDFDQMFWKMGAESFKKFLNDMQHIEKRSLQLTKEVLKEREHLEVYLIGIQEDIRIGLGTLERYHQEAQVIKAHEADIAKCKDFTYKVKEQRMVQKELDPGEHTTNCLNCNRTCHYPCYIANDDDKSQCASMDRHGQCRVCDKHCYWDQHRNTPYKIEFQETVVEKTQKDLEEQYYRTTKEKMTADKLLQIITDEFYECQMKILCLTEAVRDGLERLSEIALRPDPLTMEDYLESLIKAQEQEAQPGWRNRIDQLVKLKAQAETIRRVQTDDFDPFAKYKNIMPQAKISKDIKKKMKQLAADMRKKAAKTFTNARKQLQQRAISYH